MDYIILFDSLLVLELDDQVIVCAGVAIIELPKPFCPFKCTEDGIPCYCPVTVASCVVYLLVDQASALELEGWIGKL